MEEGAWLGCSPKKLGRVHDNKIGCDEKHSTANITLGFELLDSRMWPSWSNRLAVHALLAVLVLVKSRAVKVGDRIDARLGFVLFVLSDFNLNFSRLPYSLFPPI
jgi:hypothetical protein